MRRPGHRRAVDGADRHEALGEHRAVGSRDLHRRVIGREVARRRRPRRPAAARPAARASARRAPSSTTTRARRAHREGDPQLAGTRAAGRAACTTVPTPGTPGHRVGQDVGRGRRRRSPPARLTRRPSWPRRPWTPCRRSPARSRCRRPRASSSWSNSTISSMSDADGVEPGVGGEQAGRVGEQHQQVGADQVGDERGQAVVVAEADLVVGDGVVLVDDRDARRARAGG